MKAIEKRNQWTELLRESFDKEGAVEYGTSFKMLSQALVLTGLEQAIVEVGMFSPVPRPRRCRCWRLVASRFGSCFGVVAWGLLGGGTQLGPRPLTIGCWVEDVVDRANHVEFQQQVTSLRTTRVCQESLLAIGRYVCVA